MSKKKKTTDLEALRSAVLKLVDAQGFPASVEGSELEILRFSGALVRVCDLAADLMLVLRLTQQLAGTSRRDEAIADQARAVLKRIMAAQEELILPVEMRI